MRHIWSKWARQIVDKYGSRLRDSFNAFVAPYSKVGNPEVFEPGDFPWTKAFERDWQAIRDEALAILSHRERVPALGDVSPDHKRLDQRRSWRSFFIWGYGYRAHKNARMAPMTARLVDQVPGIITAMFSIHEPGTHLPWHRGVTKGMITCHLGLQIPKDGAACRIKVEDKVYTWSNGQWFIFDDTYYHEVWNDADEDRIILLMHIKRPLRVPGRWVQDFFFFLLRQSPFVQDARRNITAWQNKTAAP